MMSPGRAMETINVSILPPRGMTLRIRPDSGFRFAPPGAKLYRRFAACLTVTRPIYRAQQVTG